MGGSGSGGPQTVNPDTLIVEAPLSPATGAVRSIPGVAGGGLPLGEKAGTAPLSLQPVEKNKL